MKRHKWLLPENRFEESIKNQKCSKCGIYREWYGGDYQCWIYYRMEANGAEWERNETFDRPECN